MGVIKTGISLLIKIFKNKLKEESFFKNSNSLKEVFFLWTSKYLKIDQSEIIIHKNLFIHWPPILILEFIWYSCCSGTYVCYCTFKL